jgi:hypothetical protein
MVGPGKAVGFIVAGGFAISAGRLIFVCDEPHNSSHFLARGSLSCPFSPPWSVEQDACFVVTDREYGFGLALLPHGEAAARQCPPAGFFL